jgi:hypothetical protein
MLGYVSSGATGGWHLGDLGDVNSRAADVRHLLGSRHAGLGAGGALGLGRGLGDVESRSGGGWQLRNSVDGHRTGVARLVRVGVAVNHR